MSDVNAFSPDYATARRRFCVAAEEAGFSIRSHPISAPGPEAEELSIDVARRGPSRPERAVLISSGLHGVEGFLGSAVQLEVLHGRQEIEGLTARTALVLTHALNPFGFAWLRRTNEENVDLNRNFLSGEAAYQGCTEAYARLQGLLNPPRPPSRLEPFKLKMLGAGLRYGVRTLKQALAAGQYEFPSGIFYGGGGPSQTVQIVRDNLLQWTGDASRVLHLDIHTGLGRWATYKLLLDYAPSESQRAWLGECLGERAVEANDPRGIAYRMRGSIGHWCQQAFPDHQHTYVCAEFGTYCMLSVLTALRTENQAHLYGNPEDPATEAAKRRLLEAFCPASPRWRKAALEQSLLLIDSVFRGAT